MLYKYIQRFRKRDLSLAQYHAVVLSIGYNFLYFSDEAVERLREVT